MSLLRAIPALSALTPAEIAEVDRDSHPLHWAAGAVIRPAGVPVRDVLLLLGGTVSAVAPTRSGTQVWVGRWQGPAMVDKAAALHRGGGVVPHQLIAATPCHGRLLPRHRFVALLEREYSVRERVLDRLARDALAQQSRLALASLPTTARVAAWLLAAEGGPAWSGSQEELAMAMGVSRVTVNRALQRLARAGCVRLAQCEIYVLDRGPLAVFADRG